MSARTIALSDLLGRAVRDADGRKIGRIEELHAEISLEQGRSDYVVTRFSVGRFAPLDAIATGNFVQQLVRRFTRVTGYRRYEIPWDWMDLSDPAHPRALRREGELPRAG
ncbi:MAG TPA: PRC-barrel domain-containing protein [Gemmatimonadaceae bacterium]